MLVAALCEELKFLSALIPPSECGNVFSNADKSNELGLIQFPTKEKLKMNVSDRH